VRELFVYHFISKLEDEQAVDSACYAPILTQQFFIFLPLGRSSYEETKIYFFLSCEKYEQNFATQFSR